ncbi:hypothetical protein PILCRDRAFT_81007, partial [Piloderma croceum F 1598]
GRRIQTVLYGGLPSYAALSGGNEFIVELLIEQGVDVDASRLPRCYSNRHRNISAPIVGSSGSTPLHFSAAHGYLSVVHTLPLHKAHAECADKHGVTPEMLAREDCRKSTAKLLKEWLENNDRGCGRPRPGMLVGVGVGSWRIRE